MAIMSDSEFQARLTASLASDNSLAAAAGFEFVTADKGRGRMRVSWRADLVDQAETGALALSVTQPRVPDDSFELLRRALDAGVPLESWFGPWPLDSSRYGQFLTT